ncbi:hypothetical protein [Larkinella terrae]|uniref:Uncharacterized protein n=1 Tax=Larkinella terrae TaxID=2025311 RepID=A0A7K0EQS4_9BACT|nr:hypothetical protein [Larkinella terrae]MRS63788.1 hypothetical protein [Larkinella terrae]
MSNTHQLTELFANTKGTTYQCDTTNRIIIQFGETRVSLRITDFLTFKKRVDSVDIHTMIFNTDDAYDVEVIDAPRTGHLFVLSLCDLIALRDLLAGTRFVLDLNTLLNERIYSTLVF